LVEADEKLKHAYYLIELSETNFLEKTINVGLWQDNAYEIYVEIHPKTFK